MVLIQFLGDCNLFLLSIRKQKMNKNERDRNTENEGKVDTKKVNNVKKEFFNSLLIFFFKKKEKNHFSLINKEREEKVNILKKKSLFFLFVLSVLLFFFFMFFLCSCLSVLFFGSLFQFFLYLWNEATLISVSISKLAIQFGWYCILPLFICSFIPCFVFLFCSVNSSLSVFSFSSCPSAYLWDQGYFDICVNLQISHSKFQWSRILLINKFDTIPIHCQLKKKLREKNRNKKTKIVVLRRSER